MNFCEAGRVSITRMIIFSSKIFVCRDDVIDDVNDVVDSDDMKSIFI